MTGSRGATGSFPAFAWASWSSRPRRGAGRCPPRPPRHGAEPRGLRRARPGDSLASRGCHRLIRDGARLVQTVDDILEELWPAGSRGPHRPGRDPRPPPGRALPHDQERSLLGQLDNHPVGVDELGFRGHHTQLLTRGVTGFSLAFPKLQSRPQFSFRTFEGR